jgi:hypothetical protein
MLLVLATADRFAADRGSRFAASWLAALAAEEARVGLLILTDHGETNHSDQDGNRRKNDTIHLKLLPRESGKKILGVPHVTVETALSPAPPRRSIAAG